MEEIKFFQFEIESFVVKQKLCIYVANELPWIK